MEERFLKNKVNIPEKAIITIAGTVGIGKSTFTKELAQAIGYKTSMEKVDDNPYLSAFYKDFKRWAFHLQIYFLGERFKEHKKMVESPYGFVQDRSIYEDTGIFAKMHYEKGNMSKVDYHTYKNLFDAMVMTPYFQPPDLLIYLDGSLEDILERIKQRGRQMEQDTPISYWKEMHERYQEWISNFNLCPVLKINIKDYDLYSDHQSIKSLLPLIEEHLAKKSTSWSL